MKVEIFVEMQATKPHPSGGEMYDLEAETTWKIQDSITSDSNEIISGFLVGVADELDPPRQVHGERRTVIAMNTNWKIVVTGSGRGDQPGGILAELITKKNGVAGAMLRSTARSINPDPTVYKQPTLRGMDD